ncbi:MAG: glycosyltransferase family 39 protein [Blastocatellia bacterium]|nr:glycosyltransferase family 39 protein [Blastocatellia bacterium]
MKILLAVCVLQGGAFAVAVYVHRGNWLYSDAVFYEQPAWNLVRGYGFSYAREEWEDPDLTRLYQVRHPEAASARFVPAATFPPGYSFFLAGIYGLVGRKPLVAVLANGVLMIATIVLIFALARRAYGYGKELMITLVLVGTYPMWAYWASLVMSDILHVFLLSLFTVIWFTDGLTVRRALLAGFILGLAALVRPYVLLLPVLLGIAGRFFHFPAFRLRYVLPLTLSMSLPVGAWVTRNYLAFGKPMFVSMELGYGFWIATREPWIPSPEWERDIRRELQMLGIQQAYWWRENRRLRQLAFERIRQRPIRYLLASVAKIPRRWLHLGTHTPSWAKAVLGLYFGLGFVLLVMGFFFARFRHQVVLAGSAVLVIYYSLVFLPLHVEARYMLPARPFAFLVSASAVSPLLDFLGTIFSRCLRHWRLPQKLNT